MEYKYYSDAKTQRRNYLFGYYNRPYLWFQRRFTGPLLIALSAAEFYLASETNGFVLALFFGIFGIFYTLRPFIALKRIKFESGGGIVSVAEDTISISDESGNFTIKAQELLKIIPKKNYVFLKVRLRTVLYFLVDLNSLENADAFLKEIKSRYPDKFIG
ncbi:hypothetical protein EHQ12_17390 [Leptospira gomenensis]|uniref:YcxB family protein n=1 Tax=Leptospira gomenensis TaxID=2484974 RepID=A0A5F1Y8H2_9LEPT|nr:hypothetical protein [Leptospira gomenensis]TGK29464.1 hypothetical protein EHQ17_15945 [Leptospira gomenensis]TGK33633.1 hypothetical protein EHQ12_17390 [Leptospira gomenensis]TGK44874.1 hypothetical protein EHQ07_11345 [Leptospira gomenensis]TGK64495.1 hypothetical protein EHQ13_07430 [Leptospira gomenensis]